MKLNRNSRMHPGWVCFFMAFGSGCFTSMAFIVGLNWMIHGGSVVLLAILIIMANLLFFIGGRKAETLRDDNAVVVEASSQEH